MRFFWPVASLCLLAVLAVLYFRYRVSGCDVVEDGGQLHSIRSSVDTVRGLFCHAADCRLIAEQMSKVDNALWYCD